MNASVRYQGTNSPTQTLKSQNQLPSVLTAFSISLYIAVLILFVCPSSIAAQTAYFSGATATLAGSYTHPTEVAVDSLGNIYIADAGAATVTEMPANGGSVITLGGGFVAPFGVAVDGSGNVYVADFGSGTNGVVDKIPSGCTTSSCVVQLVTVGTYAPDGVAVDSSGNVYFADSNSGVFQIPGGSGSPVSLGGSGTFSGPEGLAVDTSGHIYIADRNNSAIKEMATTCTTSACVTTLASGLNKPEGVAVDSSGNLYYSTSGTGTGGNLLEEILAVGGGTLSLASGLSHPVGLAIDNTGDVYVANYYGSGGTGNGSIAEVETQGVNLGSVSIGTPVTQTLQFTFSGAGSTTLSSPAVVVTPVSNALSDFAVSGCAATTYASGSSCTATVTMTPRLSGTSNGAVELLNSAGTAVLASASVYGTGTGPQLIYNVPNLSTQLASTFTFNSPSGVAVDGAGNTYVADSANAAVYEIAAGSATATALAGSWTAPTGVAVDGNGDVFVADSGSSAVAGTVKEILAVNGTVSGASTVVALAGGFTFKTPSGIAVDSNGNIYVADPGVPAVSEILAASGYTVVTTLGSGFTTPDGVAVDNSGDVYVADGGSGKVWELVAQNHLVSSATTPTVVTSSIASPDAIAVDGNGNIYVGNDADVYEIPVGTSTPNAIVSGISTASGVAVDGGGDVYFSNTGATKVLELPFATPPTLSFAQTSVGGTSATQSLALKNIGNQQLTFTGLGFPADYIQVAGTGTPVDCSSSTALLQNAPCNLGIAFQPTAPTTASEAVTLTDNALNVSSATQQITLNGTSVAGPTATVATSSESLVYGTAASFTPVTGANGTTPYTYSVSPALPAGLTISSSSGAISGTPTAVSAASNYTVTVTDASNATATAGFSLAVTAAPLTITASGGSFAYGGTVPTITPSYSGFVNGDTSTSLATQPTCSTTAVSSSPVSGNPYPSSCSGAVDANYSITYVNGSVTVTAGSLTITASGGSFTYGGTVPTITPSFSGFVGTDTSTSLTTQPTCSTTATSTSPVSGSPYPSSCTGAVDSNYAITYVNGSVTIDAAAVTATAGSYSGIYDGLTHLPSACVLTGAYTTGLICTDSPSPVGPGVGSGAVTPSVTGAGGNFTITPVSGAWNITQASSTVTISCPASVTFNGTAQTPCTAAATGPGGLNQSLTVTYTSNTGVGTAGASATFVGDADHTGSTNSTTFAIAPAVPIVTTWPTASPITYGQPLFTSTFTGGSSTPVGSFMWTSPATIPPVGSQSESVTFVPTDTVDYTTVTGSVTVTVNAANYVVTVRTDDTGTAANCTAQTTPGHGTDASCSLRDALLEAATAGGANISFDSTAFAAATTITLTNGTLTVPSATTIAGATTGSGASLANLVTIDGGGAAAVLTVNSGVTGASIANLTIQHGNSATAGGIQNAGTLALTDDSIIGNTASGAGSGGGVNNSGTLVLSDSTVSGNTAGGSGGGINNTGTLTLTYDTIAGNSASVSGGGVYNNATLVAINNTVSGNTAATASGGGGIDNDTGGTIKLSNDFITANTSNSTPDDFRNAGTLMSTPGNVVSFINGSTGNSNAVDLAPLGNYGGPTQTVIPLPGSGAICAGAGDYLPSGFTADQRGEPNTNTVYPGYSSPACVDSGAVQTNYAISFSTEPTNVSVNTNFTAGVTLTESGSPFQPGVTIPLVLTGSGTLTGGSATTAAGVAAYTLQVNSLGSNDSLTANLVLDSAASPVFEISATSSNFDVGTSTSTVGLSISSSTATYGTQITLTATVPAAATGSVTFYNGSTVLGTGAVSGGIATFSSSTLAPGSYSITAVYSGDSNYNSGTSSAESLTISQATASVTLGNLSQTYTGSPLSAMATTNPSGLTVTFTYNGSSTAPTTAGSYTVVGTINSPNYQGSATGTMAIAKAATTTSLTVSSGSINPGQSVTLTATVTAASGASGTPTGTVNFYDGSTLLNAATVSGGTATYATTTLSSGATHQITAVYSGDTNFATSSAAQSTPIVVGALAFTLTASAPTTQTVNPGSAASFQMVANPTYGTYPGAVSFAVTGLPSGTAATFSPSSIPANGGQQTVTMSVQTSATLASRQDHPQPSGARRIQPFALAFLLLLGVGTMRRRGREFRRLFYVVLLLLGSATALLTGCGGHSSSSSSTPQTYTLTVTASSGSAQQTATVTLTVE